MRTRNLALPVLLAGTALVLAGCSTGAGEATDDGTPSVVASTSVYGRIAQEIGGDAIEVTAIIDSTAKDPHSYEATAQDQLAVQRADLIIENGGGYDAFIDDLVSASDSEAPVITAAEFSHDWPGEDGHDHVESETEAEHDHAEETGEAEHDHEGHDHIEGFNEHVWYDPHTMEHLAEAIAEELATLLPDDAETIQANLDAFVAQIADLETELADLAASHEGEQVFATEPVPLYLTAAAGLENATPEAFSEAVEEGTDVAPATLLEATRILESGEVSVVIVNAQTGGAETTAVIDTAETAGIPVVEFAETLPDGVTYIEWMHDNIAALADALTA